MAERQHIEIAPFPANIDRDEFGHWLSGFADGEGCFGLTLQKTVNGKARPPAERRPDASFQIGLRQDDTPALLRVRSFWGCGTVSFHHNRRSKIPNAKPTVLFCVHGPNRLSEVVIPHFERFPLRSKKARDFAVWREGVTLLRQVQARPHRYGHNGRVPVRHGKWLPEEHERFASLVDRLRNQRRYVDAPPRFPEGPTGRAAGPESLFDDLP